MHASRLWSAGGLRMAAREGPPHACSSLHRARPKTYRRALRRSGSPHLAQLAHKGQRCGIGKPRVHQQAQSSHYGLLHLDARALQAQLHLRTVRLSF